MKKVILIFLLLWSNVLFSFAIEIEIEDYIKAPVNGNAKIVTVTDPSMGYYRGPKGAKYIMQYNNKGQLLDYAWMIGDSIAEGKRYQYGENMYWIYGYDLNGRIDGILTRVQLDSLGRKINSYAVNKNFYTADSIVYNSQGQKIKEYTIPTGQDTMVLKYVYTYDSIGRLSTVKNVKKWEGYKVVYDKGGNYTEYHYKEYNYNGKQKKYENKFYYKDGNLVKIVSDDVTIRFSKFDEQGNWQKAVWSMNHFTRILTRTIEYY